MFENCAFFVAIMTILVRPNKQLPRHWFQPFIWENSLRLPRNRILNKLFIILTHSPKVKLYVKTTDGVKNAIRKLFGRVMFGLDARFASKPA